MNLRLKNIDVDIDDKQIIEYVKAKYPPDMVYDECELCQWYDDYIEIANNFDNDTTADLIDHPRWDV